MKKQVNQFNPELSELRAENEKLKARYGVAMDSLKTIATRKRNTREKLIALSCIYFLSTN